MLNVFKSVFAHTHLWEMILKIIYGLSMADSEWQMAYRMSRIARHAICYKPSAIRHSLFLPQNFLDTLHHVRRELFYKLKRLQVVVDL